MSATLATFTVRRTFTAPAESPPAGKAAARLRARRLLLKLERAREDLRQLEANMAQLRQAEAQARGLAFIREDTFEIMVRQGDIHAR